MPQNAFLSGPPGALTRGLLVLPVAVRTARSCQHWLLVKLGAEEQLDNRPDLRAREAYAFFQHGAAELRGGSVDGWGG